jgi:hypothetical protein
MSKSYTSSPPSASIVCSGTALALDYMLMDFPEQLIIVKLVKKFLVFVKLKSYVTILNFVLLSLLVGCVR